MLELSLNVLDLTQNSLTAGAKLIQIDIAEQEELLSLSIRDDGCGMAEDFLARVTDPFTTTRTTRKVGFGLPFVSQLCDMTGGTFAIRSKLGEGTEVSASFGLAHIDRPPLGDIAGTALSLIVPNQHVDFVFTYHTGAGEYELDTRVLREVLEGVPFSDPDVIAWLKANLEEGLAPLHRQA